MRQQGQARLRLFFALWPDEQTQQAMADALKLLKHPRGRAVAQDRYHITLAFLGDVEEERLSCLCDRASRLAFSPCTLELDQFGLFRRSGILWLGCTDTPQSLQDFRRQLEQALEPCGYRPERRPFRPHITLYRHFSGRLDAREIEPISWRIEDFRLILSEPVNGGVTYQSLAVFPRDGSFA